MRAQGLNASLLLIFCFLVTLKQYVVHCETYKQFLARTLSGLCPYSTFCTTGPAKPFKYKKYSPCCKPCSCDNDCIITGSCCPDFPAVINKNPPKQPTAECSIPLHYSYKNLTKETVKISAGFILFKFSTYHIVKTCPDEYPNAEVVRKCLHPDTNNGFVQKDISVVSNDRDYVFFNRYCAICNGATTLTYWSLKLVCLWVYNRMDNVNNKQQLFDNRCFIYSSPPTANIGGQSRCVFPDYTECNTTGRWIRPDPNIERACKSTVFPYVDEFTLPVQVYKNPYCFKCNDDDRGRFYNVCQPDENDNESKGITNRPFTAVLDLSVASPVNKHAKCPASDVFDVHFERCRPLHCPLTFTPNNGKCIQVFKEVGGLSIYMPIEVKFSPENPADDYAYLLTSKPEDFENLTQALLEDIGMTRHQCLSCRTNLWSRKDKTGLALLFGFKTNGTCTVATVTDTANKWRLGLTKSLHFFTIKDTTRLKFFKGFAFDILKKEDGKGTSVYKSNVFSLVHGNSFRHCSARVFLVPMFYCPFVDISQTEHAQLVSRNHSNIRMADFANVSVEDGIAYRICLDHYLPTQRSSTAFSLYQRVERAASTLVVIFGTICMF